MRPWVSELRVTRLARYKSATSNKQSLNTFDEPSPSKAPRIRRLLFDELDGFVACHVNLLLPIPETIDEKTTMTMITLLQDMMTPWILTESNDEIVSQREIALRPGQSMTPHRDFADYTLVVFLDDAEATHQTYFLLSDGTCKTCSLNIKKGGAVFFNGSQVDHGVLDGTPVRRLVTAWSIPVNKQEECRQSLSVENGWFLPENILQLPDGVNPTP